MRRYAERASAALRAWAHSSNSSTPLSTHGWCSAGGRNLDEPGARGPGGYGHRVTPPDVGAPTDSPPDKEETKKKKDSPGRALRETVLLLTFAILLALVVKTFFIQSFYIPSESMEPGLVVNDRILVQKPSYWNGEPERGDVIVFDDPGNWLNGLQNPQPQNLLARALSKIGLYPTGGHLVKRVIGVEGDVIVCCDEEGMLTVNGVAVDESDYLAEMERQAGLRRTDAGRPAQVQLDRRARARRTACS